MQVDEAQVVAEADLSQTAGAPLRMTANDVRLQQEAERAYEARDYARAYRIYLDRLAPRGDKHAQYMIGHMHLMGQVVLGRRLPPDPVMGCAWYRLAAERGDQPLLGRAYEQVRSDLSEQQRMQADEAYQKLAFKFADEQIRRRAKHEKYPPPRRNHGAAKPQAPEATVQQSTVAQVKAPEVTVQESRVADKAEVEKVVDIRTLTQAQYFGRTSAQVLVVGPRNWVGKIELGELFAVDDTVVRVADAPAATDDFDASDAQGEGQ